MNNNNEPNEYFSSKKPEDKELFIEVPVEPRYLYPRKISFGIEPMENIDLEGQVYRSIARGRTPWWVLITSWLLLVAPMVVVYTFLLIENISMLVSLVTHKQKISFEVFWSILSLILALILLSLFVSVV